MSLSYLGREAGYFEPPRAYASRRAAWSRCATQSTVSLDVAWLGVSRRLLLSIPSSWRAVAWPRIAALSSAPLFMAVLCPADQSNVFNVARCVESRRDAEQCRAAPRAAL